jgi:undecaprenyl-diphosphatase
MVNPLDARFISSLNHFARRSWAFDYLFVLCSNYLLRAAGIVPLFWYAWFGHAEEVETKERKREVLIFGMIACVFALLLSRLISAALPFRPRPIHDPSLHFQTPYGQGTQMLIGWSSFPSDHAAVYFALAGSLLLVSRKLGFFALGWAFFITCLPRVYLGLHYPSDILAGALLGLGVAALARVTAIRNIVTVPLLHWQQDHPAFESVLVFRDYFRAVAHHSATLLR